MIKYILIIFLFCTANVSYGGWQADTSDPHQVAAQAMLQSAHEMNDSKFDELLASSHSFAVFPRVSRTGFILGWSSGRGVLIEDGKFVGYVRQRRLSLGFQFGRQTQGQLILFQTAEATDSFKSGRQEFTPQASVRAGESGKVSEASYLPEVAVFSLSRSGLMVEAAVGSSRFKFEPMNN